MLRWNASTKYSGQAVIPVPQAATKVFGRLGNFKSGGRSGGAGSGFVASAIFMALSLCGRSVEPQLLAGVTKIDFD
jgi:hypothetical protein